MNRNVVRENVIGKIQAKILRIKIVAFYPLTLRLVTLFSPHFSFLTYVLPLYVFTKYSLTLSLRNFSTIGQIINMFYKYV